uniref:Uncharacterized protein n=1 Tax=Panagrolaimus sp. ES5 TaxID=591445 RepID=A0AC34FT40_9BILA
MFFIPLFNAVEEIVRLRGRNIDAHQMLEDGLGDHARASDISPLTRYEQSSPRYYHQQENFQHQNYQQPKFLSPSQFYPNEMKNEYNLRRCSTAANPEPSTNVYTPAAAATTAVVHPERSRRCYSTASSNSTTKKLSQRHSMSTTAPSLKDDNNMRGHSIDKYGGGLDYSDTPRTTRPLNVNRQLSQSHVDFYNHTQFRQNLRPLVGKGHSIDKYGGVLDYSDTPRTTRPLNVNRQLSQSHVDFYNHTQFRQNLRPLVDIICFYYVGL